MTYKTVKELSELWGISRQAVQKRIKSLPVDMQPKKENGSYLIDGNTVRILEDKFLEQPKKTVDNQVDTAVTNPSANNEKRIKEVDNQTDNQVDLVARLSVDKENLLSIIHSLEQQLDNNFTLLNQQQQLNLQLQKQMEQQLLISEQLDIKNDDITLLKEEISKKNKLIEDLTKKDKKTFFQRLFSF